MKYNPSYILCGLPRKKSVTPTKVGVLVKIPASAGMTLRYPTFGAWLIAYNYILSMMLSAALVLLSNALYAQQIEYFTVQSGTGFFVNRNYVITNAHVVRGCQKVDLSGAISAHDAEIKVTDDEHDLALIESEVEPNQFAPLRMDIDTLKIGDSVIVFGYPGEKGFQGQYTIAKAQVQRMDLGNVGNPGQFYISNVVQHGNSGGPVLDAAGNVIGVVVGMMQLNTVNATTHEKISEQDLGVVITLRSLQHFLEDHGIYVQWGGTGLLTYGEGVVEDNAKDYIVRVQCRIKSDGPPPEPTSEQP